MEKTAAGTRGKGECGRGSILWLCVKTATAPLRPPPDAIVCMAGTEGCGAANGCFLIAQLEAAFVESKFYLFKMAPRLPPEMRGMLRIKTEERKQKKKNKIIKTLQSIRPA